jgi:polyketide biosynthesis enoyl-CoA hydratase PksH
MTVTTITLADPALSDTVLDGLHTAFDQAAADPAARAVVLRGQGVDFCTGMDLGEAADTRVSALASAERFYDLMARMTTVDLTVVAVVTGRAVGGGVGLAAAADIVLAATDARFMLPEALWGLLPCCVLPFLIRRVGFQRAHAMTLSTTAVSGARAVDIGLADEVADHLDPPLRRLLTRVTRVSRTTIGAAKRHTAEFAALTPQVRTRATTELAAMTTAPEFRAALARYHQDQRYPWETTR